MIMIPIARKLKTGWSYLAGEKGTNRVRVYVHRHGNLYVEYMEDGRKVRRSLGHDDPKRAKREADKLAVELTQPRKRRVATLGELFDNYLRDVTPTKAPTTQTHDRTTIARFRAFLGEGVSVEDLDHRDAARYERMRRQGGDQRPRKGSGGKVRENNPHPIRSRSVAYDLKVIRAIFNWGVGARLVERNPFTGYKVKEEGTPHRPVFTESEYRALLAVAHQFPWQFKVLLMLANETGHRLNAMLQLQWKDIDLVAGLILWRGANDKISHEHTTPMTEGAKQAFESARQHAPGIGDSRVLPGVTKGAEGITHHLARDWMQKATVLAGLPVVKRKGYHAFRRKFASELREVPVRNLLDLGGWKDYSTVVTCYQEPSTQGMRAALASRKVLEA